MNPNWDAFRQAINVMLLATPFMFAVMMLFALLILGLSLVKDPQSK